MNYNTVTTILETPEQVSDLLITLTGIDIYKQTRKTEYVEHRALLCHILRNKLDMRWVSISDFIKSKGNHLTTQRQYTQTKCTHCTKKIDLITTIN